MVKYFPYDPNSTVRVEETLTVRAGKIFLRHIPKEHSVVIENFTQTDSLTPAPNQFSCQYALDSMYRDANRVLNFNSQHNGESLTVSYIAIGTVILAADMNELKAHMENDDRHAGTYILPTASAQIKGGVKIGSGLTMQGDTLSAAEPYNIGNGLTLDGQTLRALLGEGLHFDDLGRIAIYLGLGTMLRHDGKSYGFKANPDGTVSIFVSDGLGYAPNGSIRIAANESKGLSFDSNGDLYVRTGNGLAFDSNGGLFIHLGRGLSYEQGNKICAYLGDGLAFDDQDRIKCTAVPQVGNGLVIQNGVISLETKVNPQGWEYKDSGYDVIPPVDFVYVDDTHFYQPNESATLNNMFSAPDGLMEFWMRGDLTFSPAWQNTLEHRFKIGAARHDSFQYYFANGRFQNYLRYSNEIYWLTNNELYNYWGTSFYVYADSVHHFLLHMVSHPSEGYIELTVDGGTYRWSGNVNDGRPFDCPFVYSPTEHVLFSNIVVSENQLPYEE